MGNSDGRVTNHMAPETMAVHQRLITWGRSAKEMLRAWPRRAPLGRYIDDGYQSAGQAGPPLTQMSDEDLETDRAVAKLCEIDRWALEHYYGYGEPPEALATQKRKTKRHIQNLLHRARWRVGLRMGLL